MAVDVRATIKRTIADLRKQLSKKASELTSLKDELVRHEKVREFLKDGSGAARAKAKRKVRRKQTDWNTVLKKLPGSFGVANVTKSAKGTSRIYAHHVLANWIKQKKVKRVKPGEYRKV